jgi:hypothetical protein
MARRWAALAKTREGAAMIAGHFGFAALVKSRERSVPLWSLMLGTAWLDILFVPLLLAKVESLQTIPGAHSNYGAPSFMPT